MPANDLISVIMPAYNSADHIDPAIDSVVRQTHRPLELVVIDDGSSDDTRARVQAKAARSEIDIHLLTQTNQGPYPARNRGIATARGTRIAFLDADDLWAPQCLARLNSALDDASADLAYCGWQNIGDDAPGQAPFIPPDYLAMDTAAEFLRTCPWPIHAALVRTETLQAVGGFSTDRFSAMDYQFWLKVFAHTQRLTRVPEVLAFYRWHSSGQISKTKWRQVIDAWQVRKQFVATHPATVAHLDRKRLRALTDGYLLREAYKAYWQRQFEDAQILFRKTLSTGIAGPRDLRYLIPALLPLRWFERLVRVAERKPLQDQSP
ncbi:MAG: glycosyltransferase [Pseudomonadota bacterium]|nr:glycosyltransferase [Pseudomonadota bacterium]